MLKIVTYPDLVLRQQAERIRSMDREIRSLIDEMAEVMYTDDGVGLAAPQVGVSKQLIVVDAGEGLMSLINPEIVKTGDEVETMEEGCLSLPGIRVNVGRKSRIGIRGMNERGEFVDMNVEGLAARVFQHEIDHLNGILIIDHASSIQRRLLQPKLKQLKREAE